MRGEWRTPHPALAGGEAPPGRADGGRDREAARARRSRGPGSRRVVVTGARQSGKTTLVRGFPGASARDYRTLDSLTTLDQARQDPEALVSSDRPLTVDEVQRAPEILLVVKKEI